MGWEIAQKADKVRIWSTISDAWLTDWIPRDEAIKYYYDDAFIAFKKEVIKQYFSFPYHWPEHGGTQRRVVMVNREGSERYFAWLRELMEKPDEEAYRTFVDETFSAIMESIRREGI